MIGDLNEAHFALHCVAVQISELYGQNTYFLWVQNGDNNNIKVKEPDWKKHVIKHMMIYEQKQMLQTNF
jgi:hypothetical protein